MSIFKTFFKPLQPEEKKSQKADMKLFVSLDKNIENLKQIFEGNYSLVFRSFTLQKESSICFDFCLVYISELVDTSVVNNNILYRIMNTEMGKNCVATKNNFLEFLNTSVISVANSILSKDMYEIITSILNGNTVIFLDGSSQAVICNTTKIPERSPEQPSAENVIRGPKNGYTENIATNMALIRYIIKSPQLKFEMRILGEVSDTKICICYLADRVNKSVLEEVNKRLKRVEIESILESGQIENIIKDHPFSPFSTIGATERPDITAIRLLEGKVGVLVDGTPHVLTIPHLFKEYFYVNEDMYNNYYYTKINQYMRIAAFFISIALPAIYVSVVSFHQEMIPTELLLSIAAAKEGVSMPTVAETLIMIIIFEILREGSVRLPVTIGSTLSFVGALIIGDAAVRARFISAPIVIITALTGITNFLTPKIVGGTLLIRLAFIIISSVRGLYGCIFAFTIITMYLYSMKSFGIKYMSNTKTIQFIEGKNISLQNSWWFNYIYQYFQKKNVSP